MMDEEKIDPKLMGDPAKVIHYMDYQANPVKDNLSYVPDLVPGKLQPLEVYDDDGISDEFLLNLDIESIVKSQKSWQEPKVSTVHKWRNNWNDSWIHQRKKMWIKQEKNPMLNPLAKKLCGLWEYLINGNQSEIGFI